MIGRSGTGHLANVGLDALRDLRFDLEVVNMMLTKGKRRMRKRTLM